MIRKLAGTGVRWLPVFCMLGVGISDHGVSTGYAEDAPGTGNEIDFHLIVLKSGNDVRSLSLAMGASAVGEHEVHLGAGFFTAGPDLDRVEVDRTLDLEEGQEVTGLFSSAVVFGGE